MDYFISSGLITPKGFFQVPNHKEYQNVEIISFVHLEKINIFCFMNKGVAQKLSLPCPLENQTLDGHKSVNFCQRYASEFYRLAASRNLYGTVLGVRVLNS